MPAATRHGFGRPGGTTENSPALECWVRGDAIRKSRRHAWVSHERRKSKPHDPLFFIAPEICVEVESPSNSHAEFMERQRLYFEQGAVEFWICGLLGEMTFQDRTGEIPTSKLGPAFPQKIDLD